MLQNWLIFLMIVWPCNPTTLTPHQNRSPFLNPKVFLSQSQYRRLWKNIAVVPVVVVVGCGCSRGCEFSRDGGYGFDSCCHAWGHGGGSGRGSDSGYGDGGGCDDGGGCGRGCGHGGKCVTLLSFGVLLLDYLFLLLLLMSLLSPLLLLLLLYLLLMLLLYKADGVHR